MSKNHFIAMLVFLITFLSTKVFADDNALTIDVKSKILSNNPSLVLNTNITVNGSIVSLSGVVSSIEQAYSLIELAQSTPGITDVNTSALKSKDGQALFQDNVITAKVKGTFSKEKVPGDFNIVTKDGIVFLTGTTKDKAQAENATAIAHQVSGVKDVDAKINYMDMTSK